MLMPAGYGVCLANSSSYLGLLFKADTADILIASELGLASYLMLAGILLARNAPSARRQVIWYSTLGIAFAASIFTFEATAEVLNKHSANASTMFYDIHPWQIAGQLFWNLWTPVLMLALVFLRRVREYYRSVG